MPIPFAWTSLAPRRAATSAMGMAVLLVRDRSGTAGQHVGRARGGADDHRAREGRRLRELAVDEIVDDEPTLLQRLECRAVAVASDDQPVQPVEPVLPAGHGSVVGPDVLDEEEAST